MDIGREGLPPGFRQFSSLLLEEVLERCAKSIVSVF
jgi:hypothetical protein